MRDAFFAGMFYEADKEDLKEELRACFHSIRGVGRTPWENKETSSAIGAVIPHAGFPFSGACASFAYDKIVSAMPKKIFILGTNHLGSDTCVSLDDFKTPLGIAKNDNQIVNQLIDKGIPENGFYHNEEHSIEVQIPFLQFCLQDFQIIPLIIGEDFYEKWPIIKSIFDATEDAFMIASSDFTHYGPSFGYVPFEDDVKERMYDLDKKAIERITAMDEKGFIKYIHDTKATICGHKSIYVLIKCLKELSNEGKLLCYYTSADVYGNYTDSVGYASIVFEKSSHVKDESAKPDLQKND